MMSSKLVVALVGLGVMVGSVQAQELTGTLKKIKDTGTITLGVRDSSIPFSYLDDKQSYQGYSIDLCLKAATAIQKQLGMTALNVKMVPVTSATRIPLISNGTIDLSCDSATNNAERQKVVSFAPTMYVTANRLLAKKSSNVKSLEDLKGKTIVSTTGTTNFQILRTLNEEKKLGMELLGAKDHSESALMVQTGRAVAFGMDDILLYGLRAAAQNPASLAVVGEAIQVEPYAIMLRKDDPAFKKLVDDTLAGLMKSGEFTKLYTKWFQSPIPPKGINLNAPMSPELVENLKALSDKPAT